MPTYRGKPTQTRKQAGRRNIRKAQLSRVGRRGGKHRKTLIKGS